jgi:peptidoglycan/xylan/chitin deacetylase (PgdA/CDA1 family)
VVFLQFSCVTTKDVVKEEQKTDVQEAVKYCAITFDDGHDAVKTPLVLDKLEGHGAVTSFLWSANVLMKEQNPFLDIL